MSKVAFNQSGYVGSSMSVRAQQAYEDGEMPKSKWTKKIMIEAINAYLADDDLPAIAGLEKMKKDEIFAEFFKWTSWHHTGKFARETDFYSIDERAVKAAADPEAVAHEEAERMAEITAEEEAFAAARAENAAFIAKYGYERWSMAHAIDAGIPCEHIVINGDEYVRLVESDDVDHRSSLGSTTLAGSKYMGYFNDSVNHIMWKMECAKNEN
ncbi:hypothetical protein K6V98_00095 [Collinsella sp. AGMB00827]|uniref:Uncharacterized protein n=1 Tax=Collinsella ureilytica TaxID=2869515 RepID=A0ABS7MHD4_9ACTN|nr:hypothetical protein [Collinsella urealyticum]MBY4796770.1 hypothetical protein [Collinsella urealyticum]